jgi:NADH dehydrogenase FAD-containing subunit
MNKLKAKRESTIQKQYFRFLENGSSATRMTSAGTSAAAQFRDLASKSSGAVLASVLGQITQHPEIFVFGEFLALDSVRAAAGTQGACVARVVCI